MKKGFTLIELLVVIAVMGILGVILSDLLIQVLRGQNKVRIINQVKQNGQVVLDKLTQEIRQADEIICKGDSDKDLVVDTIVLVKDGIYSRYRLHKPTPGIENGKITKTDFTEDDFLGIAYAELCTSNVNYGRGTPVSLTDTDPNSGISVNTAVDASGNPIDVFKIEDEKPQFTDIVTIKFRATAGVKAGEAYEATVADGGILFATAVQAKMSKK